MDGHYKDGVITLIAHGQEEVKHFDYRYTASFRVVPPYHFEFGTSIKARWIGQPLLQVFSQEFPYFDDSVAYYTNAMKVGRLRVNDEVTPLDYRCRDGDVITHHVHRHEPPVTSHKVRILSDVNGLLVVDKPPSVPCHPGGRYRRNSLLAILAKEHSLFDLHTVHRLDRLTSGLLLIGKSKQVAEQVRQEFEQGSVKKTYLARVVGRLPPGRTLVDQPIACKSHREAIHCIRALDGKPAQTAFTWCRLPCPVAPWVRSVRGLWVREVARLFQGGRGARCSVRVDGCSHCVRVRVCVCSCVCRHMKPGDGAARRRIAALII